MGDSFEARHKRPLRNHLADFRQDLETKGDDPWHVNVIPSCSPPNHPPVAR